MAPLPFLTNMKNWQSVSSLNIFYELVAWLGIWLQYKRGTMTGTSWFNQVQRSQPGLRKTALLSYFGYTTNSEILILYLHLAIKISATYLGKKPAF